jgi:hypothetical protein
MFNLSLYSITHVTLLDIDTTTIEALARTAHVPCFAKQLHQLMCRAPLNFRALCNPGSGLSICGEKATAIHIVAYSNLTSWPGYTTTSETETSLGCLPALSAGKTRAGIIHRINAFVRKRSSSFQPLEMKFA